LSKFSKREIFGQQKAGKKDHSLKNLKMLSTLQAINLGFKYVCEMEGAKIFKKAQVAGYGGLVKTNVVGAGGGI